jgi:dynein assembly factor 6, axonemal
MSDGFTFSDIMNLNKLLNMNNEEEVSENQFYSGKSQSVLNPGNINRKEEKKETAQPYAKIEAKVNNRLPPKLNTEIWSEEDFKEESIKEDGRPKPQVDVLYKQNVKSEDIFLGLSGKSNSSIDCDQLLVKIWLPNTNLKEIGLECKEQSIHLQTPNYLLNHTLPYKVDKDNSEAKWDKEKGLLLVTLKVIKENVIDQLFDKEIEN